MGYLTSTPKDVTESLPAGLSERTTALPSASSKHRFDLDINDLHFSVRPTSDSPYLRQSVAAQKQQQDTSKEPGEQSLSGYWTRSQNSWHRGAGINFYEPGAEAETAYRFSESSGVDVWTQGQIKPLPKMLNTLGASGNVYIQDAGGGSFAVTTDTALTGWVGPVIPVATSSAGATAHNGRWYFFGTNKRIKVGQSATPSATVGIWNEVTSTVIANNATIMPQAWYLKDRLIVAHGVNIFEVPLNAAAPVDLSSAAAAAYAPADTGITWLDATDGPSAIYLGYTDGARDGVVRFTLQDAASGATPKLSQAYRVLDLPAGERLYKIFGYLGRFLLLSTSAGIRVCAVDANADLTMGQVTVPAATTGRLNSFHADSSFVYIGGADVPTAGTSGTGNLKGWGTSAGFVRLNLGEPIGDSNDLRFAWAMDIRTSVNGTVTSSARYSDGRAILAVANSGIWIADPTNKETTGYLAMGKVRYSTFAPKVFRSIELAGNLPGNTSLQVQLLNEVDAPGFTMSMDSTTGLFDTIGLDLTQSFKYVRPVLTLTASGASGPTLTQVQLQSLPTPKRLRQVRYPLKCEDLEEDARGVAYGHVGFAWERLAKLEELEEAGLPVSVIDRRNDESFSAMIDEIQYMGTTAPDRKNKNFSGVVLLTLTKLS
jgi:hypothetical protein